MAELAVMALTSAGASAATASTIGTVLSVGMTAASAFGSIQAGQQEAASLNLQAKQSDLNARAERLEGKRQARELQDQLNRDLASQNAIFAARGSLQGEGSSAAASDAARDNANEDIDNALFNSEIAALNAEQRASNARSDASAAKKKGILGAAQTVGSYKKPTFFGSNTGNVPIPTRKPSLVEF